MKRVWSVAYTNYLADPRVRREAEALAARGDQVTAITLSEDGRPPREQVAGVSVHRVPMRRYRGGGASHYVNGYASFFARAFAWMAAHRPPDVVHVHTIPDALVFAALAPRLRGCRVVLDVHDLTPDLFALKFGERSRLVRGLRLIERASLQFAHAVITVHARYADMLVERGVPAERVHVVMNVADEKLFRPLDRRPSPDGSVTFVYHGTLVERYGVEVLLRAFCRARAQVPSIRLRLLGGGDFRPRALELARHLDLEGSVQFSDGFVPVDALPALLSDVDVGVAPNLQNAFTRYILPTKVMEYAALGLPTIVSRTDTVTAYFSDEMVCYVEPGNVDDLAAAMTRLAGDAPSRRRLSEAIRDFPARYSWSANKHILYGVIDGAVYSSGG